MSLRRSLGVVSLHIVGHRLVLTSLSTGNHFIALLRERTIVNIPAFTSSCFHHGDYISAQKKIFLSPPFSFAICRETFCTFIINIVLQLGEFLALPLLKITNCLVLALLTNASLFDSHLNCLGNYCHHSSAIFVVTSMRTLQITATVRHKYFIMIRTEPLFHIYCLLSLPCPFLEFEYFQS